MDHSLEFKQSVEIGASPEKVWRTLTEPELIKEYLYGTQTITDWKVGSPIVFQGEWEGKIYHDKGVIIAYKPLEHLAYTYLSSMAGLEDVPDNYAHISYHVAALPGGKTRFTWEQQGFSGDSYAHTIARMPQFLDSIRKVAEGT